MLLRGIIVTLSLLLIWQMLVLVFHLPPYILPGPIQVFTTLYQQAPLIAQQAIPTVIETLLGLLLATIFGCTVALSMTLFKPMRYWLLPIVIISQALPTFAIAPLLVIWFGYGMASKIVTTLLILFFPITSAFQDGLRRTDPGWLDLAKTLNATHWRTLWQVKVPAALPNLATGLRVATAAAPIGAIIGEWVGSSTGLGFLMLNANARMQIDLMFAVLFVIIAFGLLLYFGMDKFLRWAIPWQKEQA